MSRPTKLTPDLKSRIIALIRGGNRRSVAILSCGISESTFYRWQQRGKRASRGIYREFWEELKAAEAQAEVMYLDVIRQAARGGQWQAAAWYLERTRSDIYGRRMDMTSGGEKVESAPITVIEVVRPSED
jgi:transposase